MRERILIAALTVACASASWSTLNAREGTVEPGMRQRVIARAQLWTPTNIRAMNLKAGPQGKGAFPFRAVVNCDYRNKKAQGQSPKFTCVIGNDDEVKVKFGAANGEVYGEVLSTRLLWALGFGADAMYPVNVICRHCPTELGGIARPNDESRFDPAVIERKMPGREWPPDAPRGWSWRELADIEPDHAGASRAQRDALTLLAVFIQHTDSKPEQQRIACMGPGHQRSRETCDNPFLMINDLGMTFGRASHTNDDHVSGVSLTEWRRTPVWRDTTGCVGNLPKSFTGTLNNPKIGEEGRRFLASLLTQLTDAQLRDLFEAARVTLRLRNPADPSSGLATVDEWIDAFKDKRAQIVQRQCA